ncbi:hypothetical protein NEMBOFW57_004295 [Staphylotrichum longicolle]|uniref:Uncharacterized protein n=1 Tax=Staphylotrichum longicolle TaxID=669026 RepID=A0AAD4I5H0_9PEZI|nr:hypothetical protein NEMBOFW57_004295 [Staphylotrichum longicolle]
MNAFVHKADPNHPFMNQRMAGTIAERESRRRARFAAPAVLDCDLNLERLFDEHFGTDVAEDEMDNAEDGDGAEASDIVDTQIGGYLNLTTAGVGKGE